MQDFQEHGLQRGPQRAPVRSKEADYAIGDPHARHDSNTLRRVRIALKDAHPQSATDTRATPLILEKNEGEHRVRRPSETPLPTGPFTIRIDRKNGASQKMFAGTEEIPAGGLIPRHKHLGQDEVLLIQTGSAHVWLGTQERDVHAGATF
jgi:mannose-6-phosphate isomerase-like protein (cupin superfamily)